jgi:hypothetical protein
MITILEQISEALKLVLNTGMLVEDPSSGRVIRMHIQGEHHVYERNKEWTSYTDFNKALKYFYTGIRE